MIQASIIADSKNEHGNRITTFLLVFPRIILAEINTHRMLSRNSASSRAIPFNKMVKMAEENPFIPIKWMKDHSGMQGNEFVTDQKMIDLRTGQWLVARDSAIKSAKEIHGQIMTYRSAEEMALNEGEPTFDGEPISKQIANRLLEPFMWHTAIVTATEWGNFFALRAHEAAEIHLQELTIQMLAAYNNSTPKHLTAGEWHIPFGENMNISELEGMARNITIPEWKGIIDEKPSNWEDKLISEMKLKIATARCARVSYLNFDGSNNYAKDIELCDRLASLGHFSPMEHCARAMSEGEFIGNFRGFVQYRKTFDNENRSDNRIMSK